MAAMEELSRPLAKRLVEVALAPRQLKGRLEKRLTQRTLLGGARRSAALRCAVLGLPELRCALCCAACCAAALRAVLLRCALCCCAARCAARC